jgi:hypothetical protein
MYNMPGKENMIGSLEEVQNQYPKTPIPDRHGFPQFR